MVAVPARSRQRTHRITDALAAVRRRLLRRRRLIAMVLLGVATVSSLRALAPPPPAMDTVLVAARDLPAGAMLDADDLVGVPMPPGVVPDGVVADPAGGVLATPLRAGEPVTDVRLVGPDLAAAQPPDAAAVPIRLADAGQVALLTAGDHIDLLATDPQAGTTRRLARDAVVLAIPDASHAADDALPGRLVVVGLRAHDVHDITAASITSYVTYAWARS